MRYVELRDAKAKFSDLVDAIASGREEEIVITRSGKPAARLVPCIGEANVC